MPIQNPYFSVLIFLFCAFCFVISSVVLRSAKPNKKIVLTDVKPVPAELMSYTLPYVVSFMSLDYQETGKFIGVIIFLAWMFLITHRSGQIILNPLFIVFRWQLSEVKYTYVGDTNPHSGRVLTKNDVSIGKTLDVVSIQNIMISPVGQISRTG